MDFSPPPHTQPSCAAGARTLDLLAADGFSLKATLYSPASSPSPALSARSGRPPYIVMGSATGVPRGFYRRFCEFAAQQGWHAIVADYRGIGESLPPSGQLKGFAMRYADWSRQDLAALVDYAAERGDVYLVGHSLGGHALGQLPRPELIRAAYFCGSGAGWHGWMPLLERIKVWILWNVIGPVATKILGYQPMSKLGMGEDLPLGVYQDWRRWCHFPHYFFDDPAPDARAIAQGFERITQPIMACASTDDLWAPPASRDAFFKGYSQAQLSISDINPAQMQVRQIGHMGYFSKDTGALLWPQIIAWLQAHRLPFAPSKHSD